MFARLVVACVIVLLVPIGAGADTINDFVASGTYASGSTLSGSLAVDVTNPDLSVASLYVSDPDAAGYGGRIRWAFSRSLRMAAFRAAEAIQPGASSWLRASWEGCRS